MALKYVDPVNGNDANNGSGPDASHATNKPWATIGKALGASGISSGDTVYLAPGVYRQSVSVAMTSATVETIVQGDPLNLQGFKTSGGARVEQGPVIWSAFTVNDTTPSTGNCVDLQQKAHLTFRSVEFVGGGSILNANPAPQYITFQDCAFFMFNGTGVAFYLSTSFGTPYHWLFDRCYVCASGGSGSWLQLIAPNGSTGADYDIDFVVRDSIFTANWDVFYFWATGGPLAFKPYGVVVKNCTFTSGLTACGFHNDWATSTPCVVKNNLFYCRTGVSCDTAGQVVEDWNLYVNSSGPPRGANVTQGGNSVVGRSMPLHMGQERIWGGQPRPLGEPCQGSGALGYGSDGAAQATDLRGRPRPAGGASALPAAGALERDNTFGKETTTVRTGIRALSATGPAVQDFLVPVDATSTSISVYVRWDSTYAGTKPQLQIDAAPGVSAETVTATGSANNWEQLTLSTFTPLITTMVRIRVISNDTNGGGKCFVDDFAVA